MRVCIVGGIFDKPADYQAKHSLAPETLLAKGLEERGHQVERAGHSTFRSSNEYEIVHVHHLGKGAVRAAVAPTASRFVFTTHNGQMLCGYERSLIRKTAFWFCARRADCIVALSKSEVDFFADSGKVAVDRIALIHNGLPKDVFYPVEKEKPSLPFNILFVGQLIPLKGLEVLFQALKIIDRNGDITLRLAYQTAECEERYRSMVRTLGIEDQVEFIGFVSPNELKKHYQDADVFVLPSYAESFPSTIMEAMLCGTPAIATKVGGIPEQLGDYGVLVDPGNVGQLVEAIAEMLEDPGLDRSQSLAMSEYVADQFSLSDMVMKHEQLYSNLLNTDRVKRKYLGRIFDPIIRVAVKEKA